jgi:hypothetical protein
MVVVADNENEGVEWLDKDMVGNTLLADRVKLITPTVVKLRFWTRHQDSPVLGLIAANQLK